MNMKKFRFSIIAFAALLVLGSCTKHKLWFPMDEMPKDWAEIQLHYMEPINNVAANNIDSVYINGTLYSSKDGGGTLFPYNGVPCMDVGKFFGVKSGSVNIRLMRGGETIYDRNVNLEAKKQNVVIHDLNADPIVIDNRYPYWHDRGTAATAATFKDDSVCKVMFVREDYRILDEAGNVLQVRNSSGKMVDYSDWWNARVGKVYMHFLRGYRTATPISGVTVWTSL